MKDKNQVLQSNVFSLSLFSSDEAMLFYSGFFNYKAFLASYEYLNPGDNGENVRYWLSGDDEIPSEHYVSSPQLSGQRGRSKSLKPQEFFSLCVAWDGDLRKPTFLICLMFLRQLLVGS